MKFISCILIFGVFILSYASLELPEFAERDPITGLCPVHYTDCKKSSSDGEQLATDVCVNDTKRCDQFNKCQQHDPTRPFFCKRRADRCVENYIQCLDCPLDWVYCPDSSCEKTYEDCKIKVGSCPWKTPKRCPNGTCVEFSKQCNATLYAKPCNIYSATEVPSVDGVCRPKVAPITNVIQDPSKIPYWGCNTNQIQCPDLSCKSSVIYCPQTNCGMNKNCGAPGTVCSTTNYTDDTQSYKYYLCLPQRNYGEQVVSATATVQIPSTTPRVKRNEDIEIIPFYSYGKQQVGRFIFPRDALEPASSIDVNPYQFNQTITANNTGVVMVSDLATGGLPESVTQSVVTSLLQLKSPKQVNLTRSAIIQLYVNPVFLNGIDPSYFTCLASYNQSTEQLQCLSNMSITNHTTFLNYSAPIDQLGTYVVIIKPSYQPSIENTTVDPPIFCKNRPPGSYCVDYGRGYVTCTATRGYAKDGNYIQCEAGHTCNCRVDPTCKMPSCRPTPCSGLCDSFSLPMM